jgi:hypothetical protein
MNNFVIFIVGIAVTLIAGMGVITSQVFIGYKKFKLPEIINDDTNTVIEPKG